MNKNSKSDVKGNNNTRKSFSRGYKGKPRKGSNVKKRNDMDVDYTSDSRSRGANDISWYATDPTLLRNAGNLPWSTQTGISYDREYEWGNYDGTRSSGTHSETVPGIAVAYLLTGPGSTEADIDAVNISANAIYTFVRHMNSGSKNYDAPDLMSYLLAMDEVFTYINWLQRLYGTIAAYNVFNRYTPQAMIEAQGVDYADLRDNMVQFKYRINLAIKQAATLVVPNNLPIYFRHAWLFSNYYIEGSDIKDQIYFYSPVTFRTLDPTTGNLYCQNLWDTTAGNTRTTIVDLVHNNELIGAMELCEHLDSMLRVLYTNEDTGIMAGDILKAYGESNIMRLSELPDAYVTPIIPNNEVLLQFKNLNVPFGINNVMGSTEYSANQFNSVLIDPNTNKIFWKLFTDDQSPAGDMYCAINRDNLLTLEGDPSVEMNMIMTRLMSYARANGGDTSLPKLSYYCGTELVMGVRIIVDPDPINWFTADSTAFYGTVATMGNVVSILSNFKYHPRIRLLPTTAQWENETTLPNYIYSLFQVDNFTYIKPEVLDRLNQVAIMSELNVPHMALVK